MVMVPLPHDFKGIVFDLDDTLISSGLSLEDLRVELGIPHKAPILEHLQDLEDPKERARCDAIVARHEEQGARTAVLNPGVPHFLELLERNQIRKGILTRNSLRVTRKILSRLKYSFDPVLTRECCPPKPRPDGIQLTLKKWSLKPAAVVMVGDYRHDLGAAQNAGVRGVLYAPRQSELPEFASMASYIARDFRDWNGVLIREGF